MKRFDLIFNPVITDKPKMVLTMFRYNHVYIGMYKGLNKLTEKEECKFFWAEHGRTKDSFFKCLISNDKLNCWNYDAIEDAITVPYEISKLHRKVINEILEDQYLIDSEGFVKKQYKRIIEKSPTLILRNEDDDQEDLSPAEVEILNALNDCWKLEVSLKFQSK